MTTTQYTRSRRSARQIFAAVGAAIALAALVVGVPLVLAVVAPIGVPTEWPAWSDVVHAVLRPDDGHLALALVRLIAWGAWAAFTWAVVLEARAIAGKTVVRRVPALAGLQRAAATLVGAVLLSLAAPAHGSSASAATEVGVVQTDPPRQAVAPGTRVGAPGFSGSQSDRLQSHSRQTVGAGAPEITVHDGDSLWFLAERHLGAGERYPEIVQLNVGRTQPDGGTLTDAHWIEPGWRLLLPADAVDVPVAVPVESQPGIAAPRESVVVQPGDSLWEIADRHLGDGARFPEIVELNEGVAQADGASLTDPSLIRPGWVLALPAKPDAVGVQPEGADAAPAAAGDEHDDAAPAPAPAPAPAAGPGVPVPDPDASAVPDAVGATGAQVGGELLLPDTAAAAAASGQRPAETGVSPSVVVDAESDGQASNALYLGVTALAAAGFIGELARRRRLQHRVRRTGERITRPAPNSPEAAAEREWHAAPTPLSLRQLRTAFDHVAATCFASGRDLPRLGAVEVAPDHVTLHLVDDDTAAVAPFAITSARSWTAPTAMLSALDPLDSAGGPEPYPALVSVGHTERATVLINLEAAGTLRIVGGADAAAGMLRALVAEVATSELTGRIGLTAGGEFADLARACSPVRLQADDPAPARQLAGSLDAVARVLASYGLEDTLQARSDHEAPDTWLPVVYVHEDPPRCAPWCGSAVITTAAVGDGWTVRLGSGMARIKPLGLEIFPSRLTADGLSQITALLAAAAVPDAGAAPRSVDVADVEARAALSALPDPPVAARRAGTSTTPALRINVLGPLRIENVPGDGAVSGLQAELLTYLALHRDCTGREIDDALWPGKRTDGQARWGLAYRTRRIVEEHNLPATQRGEVLRLSPDVTCDWDEFRRLASSGLAAGEAGVDDLKAALALVRGRPLAGVPSSAFGWADPLVDEMISAIVDVAHTLAKVLTEQGDSRGAGSAATVGLSVDATSERLRDDAVAAANARGDTDEARRVQRRYDALVAELDDELV